MMKQKFLVVVAGATATGKTALAVRLAQHFNTEIISADSRQFYCEMNIGTAKPEPAQLEAVRHHFINSHHITEEYSAGQFEKDVLSCLEQLFGKQQVVIMAGGSGLYIDAVCQGIDEMPQVDPSIRAMLNEKLEQQGLGVLAEELENLDPLYYEQVDIANPQRVVRALEVCYATGKPYSEFRRKQLVSRPFQMIKIGLDRPREQLYEAIDQRMDQMIANGLLEEVKGLLPWRKHNALQTVGYKEVFNYLDEQYDWSETVRLLKRNSRRYAKRQITWFKRDSGIHWFDPGQVEKIISFVEQQISLTVVEDCLKAT